MLPLALLYQNRKLRRQYVSRHLVAATAQRPMSGRSGVSRGKKLGSAEGIVRGGNGEAAGAVGGGFQW
jgi:hypothetical protein